MRNNDGLGLPVWAGELIAAAGTAAAGAVASRYASGSSQQLREEADRSLTYQFELQRMQEQQRASQTTTMVGLGLAGLVLIMVLK